MAQTLHPNRKNGTTTVKDSAQGGQIVTTLPSERTLAGPAVRAQAQVSPEHLDLTDRAGQEASSLYAHYRAASADIHAAADADDLVKLGHLTETVEALRLLGDHNQIRAGALQVQDLGPYEQDQMLSKREAIDLVRLNKAVLRSARTDRLIAEEAAAGELKVRPYGTGPLGTSVSVGTFETNTAEWLLARSQGIGGSDKIGHLDENNEFVPARASHIRRMLESKSPAAVDRLVTAMQEDPEASLGSDTLPIRIGNLMETTIQHEFALTHGEYEHLEDKSSRVAEGRPYHRFNPDGVLLEKATGEYGIFEAKTSRDTATFEKALPGYKAQCLHNAAAANLPFAVLVADVEGEAGQRVIRLDFTPEQLSDYRRRLDRVWLLAKPVTDLSRATFR
jgi:hypothetical protein